MFGSQRYNSLTSTFSVPTVGGVPCALAQTISASLSLAHAPTRTHGAAAKPRPPGLFKHRVCFTLHQYQLIEEPRSKRGNRNSGERLRRQEQNPRFKEQIPGWGSSSLTLLPPQLHRLPLAGGGSPSHGASVKCDGCALFDAVGTAADSVVAACSVQAALMQPAFTFTAGSAETIGETHTGLGRRDCINPGFASALASLGEFQSFLQRRNLVVPADSKRILSFSTPVALTTWRLR